MFNSMYLRIVYVNTDTHAHRECTPSHHAMVFLYEAEFTPDTLAQIYKFYPLVYPLVSGYKLQCSFGILVSGYMYLV